MSETVPNRPFSVGETSEILARLQALQGRREELAAVARRDFDKDEARLKGWLEIEKGKIEEETAAKRKTLEKDFDRLSTALEEHRGARQERLERAYASASEKVYAKIEEREGRRKFAVQKGMLDLEKARVDATKSAEQDYLQFQQSAEAARQELEQTRRRIHGAFGGYPGFRKLLKSAPETALDPEPASGPEALAGAAEANRSALRHLKRYQLTLVTQIFRYVPIWLWLLIVVCAVIAAPYWKPAPAGGYWKHGLIAFAAITVVYLVGRFAVAGIARDTIREFFKAGALLARAEALGASSYAATLDQITSNNNQKVHDFEAEWEQSGAEAHENRSSAEERLRSKYERAHNANLARYQARLAQAEADYKEALARLEAESAEAAKAVEERAAANLRQLEARRDRALGGIDLEWETESRQLQNKLLLSRNFATENSLLWDLSDQAVSPLEFQAVKFAETAPSVVTPEPLSGPLPLMLALPEEGSIVLQCDPDNRRTAVDALNHLILRILAALPPGKANFTLIDPVALGESFSAIMHLADYDEMLVNRRIWTEPADIDERLAELNAHMEKVIQMYLRNEFANIADYNKQAGKIAEKYHFVVIADFPANWSDSALRRLQKIAASGARCGVFTLIHSTRNQSLPPGFDKRDFFQNSVVVDVERAGASITLNGYSRAIKLDPLPSTETITAFLHRVGQASRGANVVRVPFSDVAPAAAERWSLSSTDELRVAIGRTGATKLQYLALGKGTRQHALLAGKTGSGKSTLLHVMITNLALWYSPSEVEFYLVDFKKGVEFKDYAVAGLPHARVIAIESDREFGLSVLRRLDEELRRRGELFRAAHAQDLASYKSSPGALPMPRVLLVVDEFQELFVEDDGISQNASLFLDRIVRQGRAFGIHVILGSQTLGGAYSLARSTLGQMVVRIALQSNEADAYLIMDENNPAPRLLSRPGEGIYNDAGGAAAANSPFQVVWLGEAERREALGKVKDLARDKGLGAREPVVFEGNAPADFSRNPELLKLLEEPKQDAPAAIWLGLPNEIKGPTEVAFTRAAAKNLLIVGQQTQAAQALFASSLLALAAERNKTQAEFILLDAGGDESAGRMSLAQIISHLPHRARTARPGDVDELFRALADTLAEREAGGTGPDIFVFIHNLASFKRLKPEDEFSISLEPNASPANDFARVVTDGPKHGIFTIAQVDNYSNANRYLGRKLLREFPIRVLFQMSAADSASLADDARASNLGLHRALLYDEQEGRFELFRPYATPPVEFVEEVLARVKADPANSPGASAAA